MVDEARPVYGAAFASRRWGTYQARRAAEFVRSHQRRHGIPPTVKEVSMALGYKERSRAQPHLVRAVTMGLLEHAGHFSRPYRIPAVAGRCACCGAPLEDAS